MKNSTAELFRFTLVRTGYGRSLPFTKTQPVSRNLCRSELDGRTRDKKSGDWSLVLHPKRIREKGRFAFLVEGSPACLVRTGRFPSDQCERAAKKRVFLIEHTLEKGVGA